MVTLGWFWITDPVATADRVWFYDMKTGALFPGPSTSIPPIAAPSDGAGPDRSGVVAQVIHLDGDSVPQIVALQSYTLDAQKLRQGLNAGNEAAKPRNDNEGTLVATPPAKVGDPIVWVKLSSNEGLGVMMRVTQMVGEKKYHTDLP